MPASSVSPAALPGLTLKAWVLFDATTAGAGAIRKSSGITSVSRAGQGLYNVVFSTAMATAFYTAATNVSETPLATGIWQANIDSKTTGGCRVTLNKWDGTTLAWADGQQMYVAIYE